MARYTQKAHTSAANFKWAFVMHMDTHGYTHTHMVVHASIFFVTHTLGFLAHPVLCRRNVQDHVAQSHCVEDLCASSIMMRVSLADANSMQRMHVRCDLMETHFIIPQLKILTCPFV